MSVANIIADLMRRVAEVERRFDGAVQQGRVAEVDAQSGTVRIDYGGENGEQFLSPPIPYSQMAGALKVHAPPSVGQQMTVLNGGGDYRQGLALPMTWSADNAAPSSRGDENALTFGNVSVRMEDGKLVITVGNSTITVTDGSIELKASEIVTDGTTKLNKGTRGVVYRGSMDTGGDSNNQGASDVFV